MYMEPCCIARRLPALLKEQGGRTLYQTNGDVTVAKMMKELSSIVGPSHVLTFVRPTLTDGLLKTLRYYLMRGWTTEVRILTSEDQYQTVSEALKEHLTAVTYATDPLVDGVGMIAFTGERGLTLAIQGPMLEEVQPQTCLYAAELTKGPSDLMEAINSKLRTKRVSLQEQPDETTDNEQTPNEDEHPEETAPKARTKKSTAPAKPASRRNSNA